MMRSVDALLKDRTKVIAPEGRKKDLTPLRGYTHCGTLPHGSRRGLVVGYRRSAVLVGVPPSGGLRRPAKAGTPTKAPQLDGGRPLGSYAAPRLQTLTA